MLTDKQQRLTKMQALNQGTQAAGGTAVLQPVDFPFTDETEITVAHNFGANPHVTVYDENGIKMAETRHKVTAAADSVRVNFRGLQSGTVHIS